MSTQLPSGVSPRWRTAFAAIRDIGMTGLALYGVWHEEHTGKVNPWLLLTYVVILGLVPATRAIDLALSPVRSSPSPGDPAQVAGTTLSQP